MTGKGWERWGAASGFAVLLIGAVGTAFERGAPKVSAPAAQVAEFFADNRAALITQSLVFMLGAAFFIWYLGSLRGFLMRAEHGAGRLATVAFGAGIAWVAIHAAAQAFQSGMAFVTHNAVPAAVLGGMYGTAYALFTLADVPLAVMLFATAAVSLRMKAFPAWLGWFSLAAGVVTLAMPLSLLFASGPFAPGGWLTYVQYPVYAAWLLCTTTVMIIELGRPAPVATLPEAATTLNGHRTAPTSVSRPH